MSRFRTGNGFAPAIAATGGLDKMRPVMETWAHGYAFCDVPRAGRRAAVPQTA